MYRFTAIAVCIFLHLEITTSSANVRFVSNYQINSKKPVNVVNDRFLSFTIEPEVLTHVAECNELNSSMNLIRNLLPAYFRIAGSNSNKLFFQQSQSDRNPVQKSKHFIVTGPQWLKFIEFANKTGLNMIVSLNGGLLDSNSNFDVTNALEFINFSNRNNLNVDWELGFEVQKLSTNDGKTMGQDVARLRRILDVFPRYQNSLILGPDMTNFDNKADISFVRNYLNEAANELNVFTLHPDFSKLNTDVDVLDYLSEIFDKMDNYLWIKDGVIKSSSRGVVPKKPIWIAESEQKNQIGQFSDTMQLVQRLGAASKLGASVYLRNPHLLSLFEPTTEYWFTVLFKSLVGKSVFDSRQVSGNTTKIYAYSHCTHFQAHPDQCFLDPSISYEKGAVTVYGVNTASDPVRVSFRLGPKLEQTVHLYSLTADNSGSIPKTLLNRQLLFLSPTNELPVVLPKIREFAKSIVIPAKSIFFVVIPNAKSRACMSENVQSPHDKEPTPTASSDLDDVEIEGSTTPDHSGSHLLIEDQEEEDSNIYVKHLKPGEREHFTTQRSRVTSYPNTKYITYSDDTWLSSLPEKIKDILEKEQKHRSVQTLADNNDDARKSKLEKYKLLTRAMTGKGDFSNAKIANPTDIIKIEKQEAEEEKENIRDVQKQDSNVDNKEVTRERRDTLVDGVAEKIDLLALIPQTEMKPDIEAENLDELSSKINTRSVDHNMEQSIPTDVENLNFVRLGRGIENAERGSNHLHPVSPFSKKHHKSKLPNFAGILDESVSEAHRLQKKNSIQPENSTIEQGIYINNSSPKQNETKSATISNTVTNLDVAPAVIKVINSDVSKSLNNSDTVTTTPKSEEQMQAVIGEEISKLLAPVPVATNKEEKIVESKIMADARAADDSDVGSQQERGSLHNHPQHDRHHQESNPVFKSDHKQHLHEQEPKPHRHESIPSAKQHERHHNHVPAAEPEHKQLHSGESTKPHHEAAPEHKHVRAAGDSKTSHHNLYPASNPDHKHLNEKDRTNPHHDAPIPASKHDHKHFHENRKSAEKLYSDADSISTVKPLHERHESKLRSTTESTPFKLEFSTMSPSRILKPKLAPTDDKTSKSIDEIIEEIHARIKQLKEKEMARIDEIKDKIKARSKSVVTRNKRDLTAVSRPTKGHQHEQAEHPRHIEHSKIHSTNERPTKTREEIIEDIQAKLREWKEKKTTRKQEIEEKFRSRVKNVSRNKRDLLSITERESKGHQPQRHAIKKHTENMRNHHKREPIRARQLKPHSAGPVKRPSIPTKTKKVHAGKSASPEPQINSSSPGSSLVRLRRDLTDDVNTESKKLYSQVSRGLEDVFTSVSDWFKNNFEEAKKNLAPGSRRRREADVKAAIGRDLSRLHPLHPPVHHHIRQNPDRDDRKNRKVIFRMSLKQNHSIPHSRKFQTDTKLKRNNQLDDREQIEQDEFKSRPVRSLQTNDLIVEIPGNELDSPLLTETIEGTVLRKESNLSPNNTLIHSSGLNVSDVFDLQDRLLHNNFTRQSEVSTFNNSNDQRNGMTGDEVTTTTEVPKYTNHDECSTRSIFPYMWCKCKVILNKFYSMFSR